MSDIIGQEHYSQSTLEPTTRKWTESKYPWMKQWWFLLLAALLVSVTIVGLLQWPFRMTRLVVVPVEGLAALIVLSTFAIMLAQDRIPRGMLVILAITLIWGIVVFFEGQTLAMFLWGWWRFFAYPLIGLFTYLVTANNPKGFAEWFIKFCIALLALQLVVQAVMFAMGYPVGDQLGGTLGRRGTGELSMVVFLINSIALGHWLTTSQLKYVVPVLLMSAGSAILGEMKFYFFAIAVILLLIFVLNVLQGGRFRKLFVFIAIAVLGAFILVPIFNATLTQYHKNSLEEFFDLDELTGYLMHTSVDSQGVAYIGRGYAPIYAWQGMQRDSTTILFGYGLGSRTTSNELGISGAGMQSDAFSAYRGVNTTTLASWMLEYGLVGMAVFLLIIIWTVMQLFRYLRTRPDIYQTSLTYGLILYTSLWPVWIWYSDVWAGQVMKALYWIALGYILGQALAPKKQAPSPARLPRNKPTPR